MEFPISSDQQNNLRMVFNAENKNDVPEMTKAPKGA
jgi:hypothetical protein